MKVIFALVDLIVQTLFWALVGLGNLFRLAVSLVKHYRLKRQRSNSGPMAGSQTSGMETDEVVPNG